MTSRLMEFVWAGLLCVVVTLVGQQVQRPISLNEGRGWDGQSYYTVAEHLAQGRQPLAPAPFVYRLGTPALVAAFYPHDLQRGFARVNLVGSLVAALLLVLWLPLHLAQWRVRVALVTLFLVTWHAPLRFLQFYPTYVDPWLFALLLAGLIALRRATTNPTVGAATSVTAIATVGVLFREVVLLVPLAWLIARPSRRAAVALGLGVALFLGIRLVVEPTGHYSFLRAAASAGYGKSLLGFVHSWFIAYGPMLVIPMVFWREALTFLRAHRDLAAFLLGIAVLSWIGGTDTERIAFWGMPVVYVLVGRVLETHPRLLQPSLGLLGLSLAQLVSARVFWTLPDVPSATPTPMPILTVPANDFQFLDLYTTHGDKTVLVLSLAGYAVVAILGGLWLHHRAFTTRNAAR